MSKDYPLTYQINYYLMKECTKCNEVKELTEFSKDRKGLSCHCKECRKDYAKRYQQQNKKKIKERQARWRENNKDIISERNKLWFQNNKEKVADYRRKRYASDPTFKIRTVLHARLYKALNGTSKSASTIELLGCTPEHARFHIESQFTEGMTWDNIHIDHIQPCASFDLEDPNEQRKCFHYTNLQPLLAEDNLRKSDSIVEEHQVTLL